MKPPVASALLTRPEAAGRLRQSIRSLDKFIASGSLRAVRIGRTVLVRESEIERFISAREGKGRAK